MRFGEWMLWGWPTGWGNKLRCAFFVALALWVTLSLPMAVTPGLLARGEPISGRDREIARYNPLQSDADAPPKYSGSRIGRLSDALRFTFRLLFKVGRGEVRFFADEPQSSRVRRWRIYFLFLHYLGTGVLVISDSRSPIPAPR